MEHFKSYLLSKQIVAEKKLIYYLWWVKVYISSGNLAFNRISHGAEYTYESTTVKIKSLVPDA